MKKYIFSNALVSILFSINFENLFSQSYLNCLSSCTLSSSTWSSPKVFVKSGKPCTQGPYKNSSCTMGAIYRERVNNCFNPALYEYTIDRIFYSDTCANDCYDAGLITELTYWLIVKKHEDLFRGFPIPECYDYYQATNASCFYKNPTSSDYVVYNPGDSSIYANTALSPINPTLLTASSITFPNWIMPCTSSSCCSVSFKVCKSEHNGNHYDVYRYGLQNPNIECYADTNVCL